MIPDDSAGFRWTGHPFIDFEVATLMAWCDLNRPEDTPEHLTIGQLGNFVNEGVRAYFLKPDLFKSVMLAFGSNFLNPSWTDELKENNVRYYLSGYQHPINPDLPYCTFFNRPSVKEVSRDAFPLLMGRGPINFYPGGQPGVPVSGQALTCAQALIFGALRSQGKLMVLAADDHELLRDIVREWVRLIKERIHLSSLGQEPSDISPPKTALVNTLVNLHGWRGQMLAAEADEEGFIPLEGGSARYRGGATLYHFSNSGQGPSVDLYPLPAAILDFIQMAQLPDYALAWAEIRRRWWPKPKAGKKGTGTVVAEGEPAPALHMSLSNRFYNDLLNLPNDAAKFVRLYFFRTLQAVVEDADDLEPKTALYQQDKIHTLWNLTELLFKEVFGMQASRIEDIKQLADRLAKIAIDNPARYRQLMQVRRKWADIRQLLRQIGRREFEQGNAPVITLDQFLSIFEIGEEAEYVDWGLAWDMVLIRLMEQVFTLNPKFLKDNPDVARAEAETEETEPNEPPGTATL